MQTDAFTDVLIVSGLIIFVRVLYKIVIHKKKTGGNTELWGTVFEALTHYIEPQDAVKEPKQFINKQKKKSGDDLGDFE